MQAFFYVQIYFKAFMMTLNDVDRIDTNIRFVEENTKISWHDCYILMYGGQWIYFITFCIHPSLFFNID